jgi:phosphoglycerate dehydrogenase-like enzyme
MTTYYQNSRKLDEPKMPNVLIFSGPALPLIDMAEEMKPQGWELNVVTRETSTEALEAGASKADFALVFGHGVSDGALRAGTNIKLVQLCSAGFDGVNIVLAGELGIPVANNGGANAIPVAEYAMTLMLSTLRHAVIADQDTRAGKWMRDELDGRDTWELSGKTVGILGAGRIGSTVARLLRGFETNTLYTDIVRSEKAEGYGATRVELDELLSESDIVTLHTPLDSGTRRLIGRRELGLMKPTSILINTCRGPVVNEADLIDALNENRIWAAGLDVFEQEPVDPANPLLKMDNVVVGAHLAGKSNESYPRRVGFAFENMQRVWDGSKPESVVGV